MSRLRLWLLLWLWPTRPVSGRWWMCAYRRSRRVMCGTDEVTLTMRDTSRSDGYSREELLEMLTEVRKHETLSGWRVPEPEDIR